MTRMKHWLRKLFLALTTLVWLMPWTGYSHAEKAPEQNLRDFLASLPDVKTLADKMSAHFTFKDDEPLFGTVDYWQDPEDFWTKKTGDCEDYALFSQYALSQKGIESHVVSFYGDGGYSHTITIFKETGGFDVMNEDRYMKLNASSVEEALSRIYPRWTWGAFAERRGTRGWLIQKIKNPQIR